MLLWVHMKAGWMCEAQNKRRKSSIYKEKTIGVHGNVDIVILQQREWKWWHTWLLLWAICHLKSYQQRENSPRRLLTCLRQTMKVNCSAKNAEVCQSHSRDIMYSLTYACTAQLGVWSATVNRALVDDLKDRILSRDTIKSTFSGNNWAQWPRCC